MARIVVPRAELQQVLENIGAVKLRSTLLPNVLDSYKEAMGLISGRLTQALTEAIEAGQDVHNLGNLEITFSEEDIDRLLVHQALSEALFPELYAVLEPFVADLAAKRALIPPAPTPAPTEAPGAVAERGYPEPQNDFERFLQSQAVPPEMFYPCAGESEEQFFERKYRFGRQYFFSAIINSAMAKADFSGMSLWFPNLLTYGLSVKGIQQPKAAEEIIKTMTILDNPLSQERLVANTAYEDLRRQLLIISSFSTAFEKLLQSRGTIQGAKGAKDFGNFIADNFHQPAYLNPGLFLGRINYPLFDDKHKWEAYSGDEEEVREKAFRALQIILKRRLFKEHESDPVEKLYDNMYMRTRIVFPREKRKKQDSTKIGPQNPEEVSFPGEIKIAYHLDNTGHRWKGRVLKLRRCPNKRALFPRVFATKDEINQQNKVREEIIAELSPLAVDGHLPANFALLFIEQMCEIFLEGFWQDVRANTEYHYGNPQRGFPALLDTMAPSNAACNYSGKTGTQEAPLNPHIVGWQTFLLTFFDYILLRGKDGRVLTLAQHILKAKSFADVPWEEINDGLINNWTSHLSHMGVISEVCLQGKFNNGDIRNIVEVDPKTNQIKKINGDLNNEIIGLHRYIRKYFLELHCNPGPQLYFERDRKRVEELALRTGQFMKITIECVNPHNSSEIWRRDLVTRAHQYLSFDREDFLDWIPRNQLNVQRLKSGTQAIEQKKAPGVKDQFAEFVTERFSDGTAYRVLRVRIGAKPGSSTAAEALPDPLDILTMETMTRVLTAASAKGRALENLRDEDRVGWGLILSEEVRQLYKARYFDSVGRHTLTRTGVEAVNLLGSLLRGQIQVRAEDLEKESLATGPDLLSLEQLITMLEKAGDDVRLAEAVTTGKTFLSAVSGGKSK